MQYRAILCNTVPNYAIQCRTMQYHAIPWNTMKYHAIPCIMNNCCRSVPLPCGQFNGHFSIWNFYIFHYTLICRFADVHGSCRAQKWNINNYRGCCVQRIFSKNRFGGQTIGTVLHMSVGPFGPGIGIYPNIWDVVYKVYYKKKDFEAK